MGTEFSIYLHQLTTIVMLWYIITLLKQIRDKR
jgi:hypothetical protein